MCLSLRGAAYYGASLHISVAILYFGIFLIDLIGISEVWHNPYATYFSLILAFMYIALFGVFGLLIFRGVESESGRLLKGAIAGFLILQLSALLVYLALLLLTYSRRLKEDDDIPIITLLQVIILVIGGLTTLGYTAIEVTYVRSICPRRGE